MALLEYRYALAGTTILNTGRLLRCMANNLSRKFEQAISEARRFDSSDFVALRVNDAQVGWVRRDHAHRLGAWPDIFRRTSDSLILAADLENCESRSAALASVVYALARDGAITGWRDELCAVTGASNTPALFYIERAAARFFGTTTYAAHLNGYIRNGDDCRMWLARRGKTKQIEPGKFDNLVGGGIVAHASAWETLVKEGCEEAGIGPELMAGALASESVRIMRAVPEGMQSEVIFVYSLELPLDFQPYNRDGEVAEFRCARLEEVIKLISAGSEITLDASLVIMRFLMTFNEG